MITLLPLLISLGFADATPLASKIEAVTLYSGNALVRRTAHPVGSGSFVLRGLPHVFDPNNVRVRCEGGDVLHVETRERLDVGLPEARLKEIQGRLTMARRELLAAEQDGAVTKRLGDHLLRLLDPAIDSKSTEFAKGRPSTEAWASNIEFLTNSLENNHKQQRLDAQHVEDRKRAVQTIEAELGSSQQTGNVAVYDVQVDLEARGPVTLDVEYFVANTGWLPAYDLRTAKDLSSVELTYRAQIWQETGEDWNDVALALSTARPQIGAQGPEPAAVWLGLSGQQEEERLRGLGYPAARYLDKEEARNAADWAEDQAVGGMPDPGPRPFANVISEGLSVRFALPQRTSVESRKEPTTVLVGSAKLAIEAERRCVPALETTVWLRGKAKNTSAWTLLPGTAAVFFGADYLGPARIATVQPGQELTLALGADASISVTRTRLSDLSKGPGFLSSKASKVESWKLHFENHGAVGAQKDGSVEVIVQEALPRPRDERIEFELSKSEPKPSADPRFAKDKEEKGIETWLLRIPKAGASDLVYETTTYFPKGATLVRQ